MNNICKIVKQHLLVLLLLLFIFVLSGCASVGHRTFRDYESPRHTYGHYLLDSSRSIYVCEAVSKMPENLARSFSPEFNLGRYVSESLVKEIFLSGSVAHLFESSGFKNISAIKEIIIENGYTDSVVFIFPTLNWVDNSLWSVDFTVLDNRGESIFEKRTWCGLFDGTVNDTNKLAYMIFRQLLNDPEFIKTVK